MSFLSGIKNFIKTEILGIEEINTETQNVQKKDNTPVIECETEKPVDKYEKGDSDKSKAKRLWKKTLTIFQVKTLISRKCLKTG